MNAAGKSTLHVPGRTASAEPFMSQHTPGIQHRLRFPLWVLLALPAACAPLFLWLAMSRRVATASLEDLWIHHPGSEFPIKDGDWAGWGANLVYVASVSGPWHGYYHRVFWSVNPEGALRGRVDGGNDAWTDTKPAPPGLSARLPGVLRKLPPSVPRIDPMNRVVVAFAVNGRWAVRSYPRSGPTEFGDLMQTLFPPDVPPAKSAE
jgi:hypothetical protein